MEEDDEKTVKDELLTCLLMPQVTIRERFTVYVEVVVVVQI